MTYQKKIKFCFLILFLTSNILSCVHSLPSKPTTNERLKITVIPGTNKELDVKLSAMLTTALKKDGYFVLIDKNKIKSVFEEQQLQHSGIIDQKKIIKLGNLLDARYVILSELIRIKKDQSSSSVSIGLYETTISAKIIDTKSNRMIALMSETGRSVTGGLGVKAEFQGKKKDELLGAQRSSDDMLDAALRSGSEKIANSIINAVYNKNNKFLFADVIPTTQIETWARIQPENRYSQALSRLFLAPYDIVWSNVLKYFGKDIMISDKQKGIIITKAFDFDLGKRQVFILIEREKLDCTKITLKGFCYSYNDRAPAGGCPTIWTPKEDWVKYKGSCYNIYPNSQMCSNAYIMKLTSVIEKELK